MRKVLLFFIFLSSVCIANDNPQYRPLTDTEKKEFLQAWWALKNAYREGNFEAFNRFAPGIMHHYESVLLDPECKQLRVKFTDIQNDYTLLKVQTGVDSLNIIVSSALKGKDFVKAFKTVTLILESYKANSLDSLFTRTKEKADSLVQKLLSKPIDMTTYVAVQNYPFIDPPVLEKFRVKVEATNRGVFSSLSSNLDYDEISKFQETYPTLFAGDVAELKQMAREKMKTKALRLAIKDDLDELIKYREKFGNGDAVVERILEKHLFTIFITRPTEEGASKYLLYYPNSKKADYCRSYINGTKNNGNQQAFNAVGRNTNENFYP